MHGCELYKSKKQQIQLINVGDRPSQPIKSLRSQGYNQWEAVIGARAALIPLREAPAAFSAMLSSNHSAKIQPESKRVDTRNKITGLIPEY